MEKLIILGIALIAVLLIMNLIKEKKERKITGSIIITEMDGEYMVYMESFCDISELIKEKTATYNVKFTKNRNNFS